MGPIDALTVGLRDLRRQPVRSVLTIIALAISSSLFVALVTLGLATREAINDQLSGNLSASAVMVSSSKTLDTGPFGTTVQQTADEGAKLDQQAVNTLSQLPGVRSATPLAVVWPLKEFSVQGYDRTFVARANAVEPSQSGLFNLAAGRPLSSGDTAAGGDTPQVILGFAYAKALGLDGNPKALVGRTVRLTTQNDYRGEGADLPSLQASRAERLAYAQKPTILTATIVGVSEAGDQDNLMLVPMAWARGGCSVRAQTATGVTTTEGLLKNGYANVILQLGSSRDVRATTARVDALGFGASSQQQQIDEINQLSTVMWITLGSISLISMISASLGIVNTMLMSVSEQRYAIGVWRACGATRLLIVRMFVLQACVLGLVGGVLGTAVGIYVSSRVNHQVGELLRAQGLDVLVIASASWSTSAAAVGGTTLLAIAAGLYPALKAARNIYV